MKAKNYKSITEILKKKYNKNFYDFEDFEDVLLKIKRKDNNEQYRFLLLSIFFINNINNDSHNIERNNMKNKKISFEKVQKFFNHYDGQCSDAKRVRAG